MSLITINCIFTNTLGSNTTCIFFTIWICFTISFMKVGIYLDFECFCDTCSEDLNLFTAFECMRSF